MASQKETIPFVMSFGSVTYDLSSRTHVMGILNVTPDSFSDGGRFLDVESAVDHAQRMQEEGADFIDVGGESSRPGSEPITVEEELRRTIPVIERLAAKLSVPISIDTYKSDVARRALAAGATIVNDISAMTMDPHIASVAAEYKATVVLMHMKGTPKNMQVNPTYSDVVQEVRSYLAARVEAARAAGISQVLIDPGIGFGKLLEHNLALMRGLGVLREIGVPVLVGPSRKSFLGTILNVPVDQRLEGTAAAVAVCILNGAHVVRVHDVQPMVRVARVADALKG
jgi:dihydropteroate synthase